jgi:hypothetical protein
MSSSEADLMEKQGELWGSSQTYTVLLILSLSNWNTRADF